MTESATGAGLDPGASLSKGRFVIELLSRIEAAGHRVVYLRNYENLPDDIGNDVDILIERGKTKAVVSLFRQAATEYGWRVWKSVPFSCLSVFLVSDRSQECIHIDLFEHLEWHVFSYADAEAILARRVWSGFVFKPALADEIFLNLATRLVYHGIVREKHRRQWDQARELVGTDSLKSAFSPDRLGLLADEMIRAVSASKWDELESLQKRFRRAIMHSGIMCHPLLVCSRVFAYLRRACGRLMARPGFFVSFVGAEDASQRSKIEEVASRLEAVMGLKETLFFHWKPSAGSVSRGGLEKTPSHPLPGKHPKSALGFLAYLACCWVTFWLGYFRYLLPPLIRNRLVVANQYGFGGACDYSGNRSGLPGWVIQVFMKTLPRPNLTVAFAENPQETVDPNLGTRSGAIADYPNNMHSGKIPSVLHVQADSDAAFVATRCLAVIFRT